MAYTGATKILKPGGEQLDPFEQSVSQVSTGDRVLIDAIWLLLEFTYNNILYVGTDERSVCMCTGPTRR
jgi:hypothetical protein